MKKNVRYAHAKAIERILHDAQHLGRRWLRPEEIVAMAGIKILQINVDRGRAAQDLLYATAAQKNIDIVILSEPNIAMTTRAGWPMDNRKNAAVGVRNKTLPIIAVEKGNGYVCVQTKAFVVYSCYISPNSSKEEYESTLRELIDSVRNKNGHVLIAGDFNAKAPGWGHDFVDWKGQLLTEALSELDLVVHNNGTAPTFVRGESKSFIDLTLTNAAMSGSIKNWHVSEEETHSTHRYIEYAVNNGDISLTNTPMETMKGWNLKKLDPNKLKRLLQLEIGPDTNSSVEECIRILEKACDAAMPKKIVGRSGRKQVYWWNEEIAMLRSRCLRSRRNMQRLFKRRHMEVEIGTAKQEYQTNKKALRMAINRSKKEKWKQVCNEVDQDVWGCGYKIVTKAMKLSPAPKLTIERQREIVDALFPHYMEQDWNIPHILEIPPFTREELQCAANRLKSGKAPGPDSIPAEIVKILVNEHADYVIAVMNALIYSGEFPEAWKTARLVLLRKQDKPLENANSFRPLCLLDAMAKLLEQLLARRLEVQIENGEGLSDNQYGFRKRRSTVQAVEKVVELAKEAKAGTWRTRRLCVLVTVDVRNAFNSASWQGIMEELVRRNVAPYLLRILGSYLQKRKIIIREGNISEQYNVTCGVPQGSVLGPALWNIFYDGILKTEIPEGARIIGFADDLGIIATGKTEDDIMMAANGALARVSEWLRARSLSLAPEKTEAVLLVGRRKHSPVRILVDGEEVAIKKSVKYLGVIVDSSLNFGDHTTTVAVRAEKAVTALNRLLPNIGGPRSSRRRVLASVAHSIMLYGAEIWGEALKKEIHHAKLRRVQRRMALRVCGAYRTVSTEAALVIAGVIPIRLLAEERSYLYRNPGDDTDRMEARERTIDKWQEEWTQSTKGAWTRRLIPDIRRWLQRKHGEVGYYTTQILTGHGCFANYVQGIGKKPTDTCWYCVERDTAEHTLLHCVRWSRVRREAEVKVGDILNAENVVRVMLESEPNWTTVEEMMRKIMQQKEKDERERQQG